MDRRRFIKTSGLGSAFMMGGGISSLLSSCMKDTMSDVVGPVTVIEGPFTSVLNNNNSTVFGGDITAQNGIFNPFNSGFVNCLGYHGGILGPTIRKNNGDTFTADFHNEIGDYSNIHWHGLIIPENMDGHPKDVFGNGSSFQYSFTINQRAGMYWYHPHPHGETGRQVFKGLAGLFIVSDAEETALALPSGTEEIPLVIQDKRFFPDRSLDYSPSMDDIMSGYMGQYVLVNGLYAPWLPIARKNYRLRILNGSNARVYNLAFSNGMSFSVIGSDSGLLAAPASVSSVLLGPGERLDIIMNAGTLNLNEEIYLVNKYFDGGSAQGQQEFRILKLLVNDAATDSFTLPAALSTFSMIPESSASNTRIFDIAASSHHGHGSMTGMHKINGKIFDMNRIDETVAAGTTEIWEFDNTLGEEPHPIHIHGVMFQVLDRIGGRGALIASETGWKDTVMLMPSEKVRLIMTFPNNPGKFVFHCHNLEHSDDGMMLQYEIV